MDPDQTKQLTDVKEPSLTLRDFLLFVALPVLAFWLRIGTFWQSLWYDEVLTARVSSVPYMDSLRELALHNTWHPPLYYWLNHLVLLVTNHDWANRLIALFFGLAVFPLMYQFAKRVAGKPVAYLSLVLLAISPIHVQISHDAREYTLFLLLSLGAMDRLLRALDKGNARYWIAFSVLTALSMYSSFFAFFAIFSQSLFIVAWQIFRAAKERRIGWGLFKPLIWFAVCIVVALAAYAPVLPIMLSRLGGNISPTVVKYSAISFGWPFFRMLLAKYGCGIGWPLWIMGGVIFFGFFVALVRKPRLFLLGLASIASVIPFFIILRFSKEQIFSPRYIVFVLPVVLTIASMGLYTPLYLLFALASRFVRQLQSYRTSLALIAGVCIAVAVHLPCIGGMFVQTNENWREVCDFIARHQNPDDAVILQFDYTEYAFAYYRNDRFQAIPLRANDVDGLRKVCAEHPRVWYVGYWGCPNDRFGNEMQRQGFLMLFDQIAQGVRLDLLDKSLAPGKVAESLISWRKIAREELRYHPQMDVLISRAYYGAGNEIAVNEHLGYAVDSYCWLSNADAWLTTEGSYRVMALKDYGEALRDLGRLEESESVLCKAAGLAPEKSFLWYSLALTEMRLGKYGEAAALFDKLLPMDKTQPYWLKLKAAEAFAQNGEIDKAITICREGYIELDGKKDANAPVLGAKRAELIALFVDKTPALQVCVEVKKAYPAYAHIYAVQSAIEYNSGDARGALETIGEGLRQVPNDPELAGARAFIEKKLAKPLPQK